MKWAQLPVVILIAVGFLTAPLRPARAEWFGDLYLGAASSEDGKITRSVSGATITEKQDFGSSFTIGLRVGTWLENILWLGIAIDYSIFGANIDQGDVVISPISFLAMVRMQTMESNEFPNGRLQPYFGIGPGLFYAELNSFTPAPWGPLAKTGDRDTSIDLGLDLRVGLAWSITCNLALFGEYRLSTVDPGFEENVHGVSENMEIQLTTHDGLAGISCRF